MPTDSEIIKEANRIVKEAAKKFEQNKGEKAKNEMIKELIVALKSAKDEQLRDEIISQMTEAVKIAIKEVRVEVPEIKIPQIASPIIPEIKIPTITIPQIEMPKIPAPQVTIKPTDIKFPEIKMPKEIKVTGFASFVKAITEILKHKATSIFSEVDRDNPLPVILTDDKGTFYKALQTFVGGSGFRIVEIGNEPTVNVKKGVSPSIYTVTMTSANTSYSLELPANTVMIDIKLRSIGAVLKYSWTDFGVYMSIPAGGSRHIDGIKLTTAKTIYFQSVTASQVAEIEIFTE